MVKASKPFKKVSSASKVVRPKSPITLESRVKALELSINRIGMLDEHVTALRKILDSHNTRLDAVNALATSINNVVQDQAARIDKINGKLAPEYKSAPPASKRGWINVYTVHGKIVLSSIHDTAEAANDAAFHVNDADQNAYGFSRFEWVGCGSVELK